MSTPPPRILVLDRTGELAARIRHNVLAPEAVVKACPNPARVETHLAAAHWDAIVAGPSLMHRGGLRRLASLHQRYPWLAIVLALHERPRADLAEIIQVGADDLIPLHADDTELRRTLSRAARITRGRLEMMTDGPGAASRGRVVMVSSASGGCGKTFLATNAAEFLARATGQPVVLVDLDLQFGEVSIALRLRPEVTITDVLAAEAEGHELDEILDDFLLDHPDGFKVLAAPRLPAEADSVTPGDVTRVLDVLRARGAWVVIDTHEGLGDLFVAAVEATDHLFAVATPDRPSLVNLGRYLEAIERLGIAAGNISVVLNKAEADTGLDPVDMAAELGRRFEAIVPYSREVSRSVNTGVPLIVGKPKSSIAKLLTTAMAAVLPGSRPETAPATVAVTTARAPLAAPALPEPPVDPSAAGREIRIGTPIETNLTEPRSRPCAATLQARPVSRCRRATESAAGASRRGRDPPYRRIVCEPDPPHGGRRSHRQRCGLRPPFRVLSRAGLSRSIWPDSYPALVRPAPPNGPPGLSGMPRTPPTKEVKGRSARPSSQTSPSRGHARLSSTEPPWRCAGPPRC